MVQIVQFEREELELVIRNCLIEAIQEIKSIPTSEELADRIDKNTVRQMTGKSDQWVYQKTTKNAKDPLPFQKFGRELVFSRKAIQEYIDSHTLSTPSPESVMTDRLQKSANKKLK